jgi:hypothetical protein
VPFGSDTLVHSMDRRRFLLTLSAAPLAAQTQTLPESDLEWHDVRKFTVEGLGFKDRKAPFDRLPERAEAVVPAPVWNLSHHSAGVLVRFVAGTPALHARWTIINKALSGANMTPIAASGLDLYAKTDAGKWRWLGVGRPTKSPDNTDVLVTGIPSTPREFMLYFPLYNGVTSVEIGVPKGGTVTPAPGRAAASKPIVFYGTSITHGASASRSGMCHPAILGRAFNREVINLGFSGNGRMEEGVMKLVAELDPAVFILDCLPNMTAALVRERAAAGVKILRAAHPDTPILLVEDRNYDNSWLVKSRRESNEANHAALHEAYETLQAEKVKHLHYLKADNLLGSDGEATIDSSHPTDLGFVRQAAEFERVLKPILK